MKEKITEQFIRDIDEFIADNGIWLDFISFMQEKGYCLNEDEPLQDQLIFNR